MATQYAYAYNSKNLTAMGAVQYVRLRADHQETVDKLFTLTKECTVASKFRGAGPARIRQFIETRPEWMRPYLFMAIDRYSRGAIFVDHTVCSAPTMLPELVLKGIGCLYADIPVADATRIDHIRIHHGFIFLGYNFAHAGKNYCYDYTIYADIGADVKYEQWFVKQFKGVPNDEAAGQRCLVKTSRQFKVGDTKHGPHSLIIRGIGSFGLPKAVCLDKVSKIMVYTTRAPDKVDTIIFKLRIL